MIIKKKLRVIILICSLTLWFTLLFSFAENSGLQFVMKAKGELRRNEPQGNFSKIRRNLLRGGSSFARSSLDKEVADLGKKIETYFSAYYKIVNQGKSPPASQTLEDVKSIFLESRLINEKDKESIASEDDFFNLTLLLNQLLRKYELYINIFLNPQTNTIDCWLAESGGEEKLSLTIWGEELSFSVITFDNLLLHGYGYYYSPKREDIQFLSFKDTIFSNREEIKRKAKERWQLLLSRYYKKSSYNPYASEKLRRDLLVSAWQGLFLSSVRENNLNKAKDMFIIEAVKKLKRIGIYHELGHRLADERYSGEDDVNPVRKLTPGMRHHIRPVRDKISKGVRKIRNDPGEQFSRVFSNGIKSEMAALLSEMRFGSLPKESLNTLLSFAWRSKWPLYQYSAQAIIRDFLGLIEKGVISKELKKRLLMIKGGSLLKKQSIFRHLSYDDIMKLSEEEFRRVISN